MELTPVDIRAVSREELETLAALMGHTFRLLALPIADGGYGLTEVCEDAVYTVMEWMEHPTVIQ